jgi:hypothetical protein
VVERSALLCVKSSNRIVLGETFHLNKVHGIPTFMGKKW